MRYHDWRHRAAERLRRLRAPVAQRIEHRFPKPCARVRVPAGVPKHFYYSYELTYPPFLLPLPAPQVCFPSGNTRQSGQARRPLNFHAAAHHALKGPGPVVRMVDVLDSSHEQVTRLARASSPTVKEIRTLLIGPECLKLLIRWVMSPPRIRDCQGRYIRLCHHLVASRTRPAYALSRPTIPSSAGRHAEFWHPPLPDYRPYL